MASTPKKEFPASTVEDPTSVSNDAPAHTDRNGTYFRHFTKTKKHTLRRAAEHTALKAEKDIFYLYKYLLNFLSLGSSKVYTSQRMSEHEIRGLITGLLYETASWWRGRSLGVKGHGASGWCGRSLLLPW